MGKKNKVAVISIWDIDNYGNRLQNYGMQSALRELGYEPYTLKMWPQTKWKRIVQYLTNFDVSLLRLMKLRMSGNMRKYRFLEFERAHIRKDRHFYDSEEDRGLLNKTYPAFVVGSDQVWHPVFLKEPYYFLKFADEKAITVSYAASMGVSKLEEESQALLKEGLSHIEHVSVREDSAAAIIRELTGKDVPVVIDPTLLVKKEEWESLEKKPENIKKDYMLLYYLGNISEDRWELLNKISKENNLDIIVLGKPEYKEFYDAGPAEFLYLIHHAKLMCTDSFHGCVFSFLFETPFYAFNREDQFEKMNSRIDTLLTTFMLKDRYMEDEVAGSYSLTCDFSKGRSVLKVERERCYKFLSDALQNNN